ncbi:MAG: F0F1 ATP synthase subunit delta [Patescibacteria group bacterium]
MKYTPRIYAKALIESLAGASAAAHEGIIKRFFAAVRRRGDVRRVPEIIEAVRETLRRRVGGRLVEIAFARRHKKSILDSFRTLFTKHDEVVFRTEPELAAGVRITIDGEREFDQTAARRIKKLFR